MMFFSASKMFWFLCAPSHVIFGCALVSALLLLARRRAGIAVSLLATLLLTSMGIVPSYNWIGRSLESQFDGLKPPAHADGILILGGGREDVHRLPVAFMLARQYPEAQLVFSGGSGALVENTPFVDAERARRFLLALGLDPRRLVLEGRSRNTYENFLFASQLTHPRPGQRWILVTSAYHMPRAMEIARQIGWPVFPWPSDRLTDPDHFSGWFDIPENLRAFDMLAREHIGLLVYRWTGRSARD